jgi:hypothetical protein
MKKGGYFPIIINSLKKHMKNPFILACLTCSIIILGFFAFFYITFGHSGIPIGWDTPHYINQMLIASRNGLPALMQQTGYYNFGYAILSSFLVIAGLSPFIVEIILPIILCISIISISGILARKFWKDQKTAIFTVLFATTWFALYRLGSDLHSNLLALLFVLASSYFFFIRFDKKNGKLKWLWFFPLLMAASFTHAETAIFFAAILLLSTFLTYLHLHHKISAKYSLRRFVIESFLIVLSILPSTLFFITNFTNLLSQTEGVIVTYAPLSITNWIAFIGIFFPLTIPGFFLAIQKNFRKHNYPFNDFITAWFFISIAFAMIHYVFPTMMIFSERALILFPTPFVFAIGLRTIMNNVSKSAVDRLHAILNSCSLKLYKLTNKPKFYVNTHTFRPPTRIIKGAYVGLIFAIFTSSFLLTSYYVKPSLVVYLPSPAYEKLTWLSNNHQLSPPPIFVYNDYDQYAGGLANLYSNWVQVTYGDHYSYVGDVESLLALSETPFKSTESKAFSKIFLENMINNNIFNKANLLKHEIIIISDFYLPRPIPTYNNVPLEEISDGIFIVQSEKLTSDQNVHLPLYFKIIAETSSPGWYKIQKDWAKSTYALEYFNPEPSNPIHSDFIINIAKPGNYSFILKYFDAIDTSSIILEIEGISLGKIQYRGTLQPANFTADFNFETAGIYNLRIILEYAPNQSQYASLDYLEIIPLMN